MMTIQCRMPRVSRSRRAAAYALWGLLVVWPVVAQGQQAVYLVRHAERADQSKDAALSPAGVIRADWLAEILRDAGVDAVYATPYRRTIKTAEPLARARGLEIQTLPPDGTEDLVERLRRRHADDIVLVVGHSNTVPEILRALGGPVLTIADDEFDRLFVVVPQVGGLSRVLPLRY